MEAEGDALEAAAAQARRVLRENQTRADKLQNVLCILQGKQDAAKRALEEAVARHAEAVHTWKAAFRQVIDSEFVHKAKLLHNQVAIVRRATVGLHAGLDRLEALRFSPAAAAAAPAVADVLARYVAESREVQPDLLLDFAFHEVPPDRWARSRLAVGYLQTSSLAPTDLALEEVAADGLTVTLQARSEKPYDMTTVTHLSYSVLDAAGLEVTEVVWVDGHDGCFTVTFRAAAPGAHVVSVYLYSVHVSGSPLRLRVGGGGSEAAERRDAAAQTDEAPDGDGEDFVGWMRARLERELSLPSPQVVAAVEGAAAATPVRRPVVGSGRLRLPARTDIDDNNNEPQADWNPHLFDGPAAETKAARREDTAERLRAALMGGVKDGGGGGGGDGVTRPVPTRQDTVKKSAAPPPGPGAALAAEFGQVSVPGEAPESLRRPLSASSVQPPSLRVVLNQEASSGAASPRRVVTETGGPQVREVSRPATGGDVETIVVEAASSRPGDGRVVKFREGGKQTEGTLVVSVENGKKPEPSAAVPAQKSGAKPEPGRAAGGGDAPKPQPPPRTAVPRPLRTVRVTSDDLAATAGPTDLSRGPVTAKLELLLRPTPLFKKPIGVAAAGDTLFIADTGNDVVRAFSADGSEIDPPVAELRRPSALAALSGGRLAVRYDQGVRVYAAAGSTAGRLLLQLGAGLLRRPFGLAVTQSERLVTVDCVSRRPVVHVFDVSAAGEGRLVHSVDITPVVRQPETAKLYFVAASETRVAVSDLGNNVVLLLNWEGRLVARVGEAVGPEARLCDPAGLALDPAGNLLVADSKHHRLLVFGADGAPRGSVGVSHKLNRPSGVCLQGGRLFVLNYWEDTAHCYHLTVAGDQ